MIYHYLCTNKNDEIIDYLQNTINVKLTHSTNYFDYDFNNGFRIKFKDTTKKYHLIILDKNTRFIYYKQDILPQNDVIYVYPKKYYIEYEIILLDIIDEGLYNSIPLAVVTFAPENKNILFLLSNEEKPGMGDAIAWMTAIYKFKLKHPTINVYICTSYDDIDNLIKEKYNCFNFIHHNEKNNYSFYATYLIGCFFNDPLKLWCPKNYRDISLTEMGYSILGLEYDNNFSLDLHMDYSEEEPYVCISTHGSAIYKEWLFINGWEKIIEYLNECGYKVYVIDAEETNRQGPLCETKIPHNAINKTGKISLIERAKLISGADFFIGISSGLSWLAWACKTPVILISGFTSPTTEFNTPYRIINTNVCNSCWNDHSIEWNMNETVCPRNKNPFSSSFIECSTKIGIYSIINMIQKIPIFKERMKRC